MCKQREIRSQTKATFLRDEHYTTENVEWNGTECSTQTFDGNEHLLVFM